MTNPEHRLDSREAAAFLTGLGFKTAASTLSKLRCVGGGPQCELFGRRPIYSEQALLDWARAKTRTAKGSTPNDGKVA
jgi:hypothetical protein